jgi:HAD superfamily hydrolase (TIGR01509 family)
MIKALIFDFDGIIIDSESPELVVWQEAFAAHGHELKTEIWSQVIGRPQTYFNMYSYFREHINPTADIEELRRAHRARVVALTLEQPILPGVEDYLRAAAAMGLKVGLASSSSGQHVRGHLGRLELLDHFHATRCFEDTVAHKPDPAPYLAVLEDLDVSAEETVAFEDSPNGVTSAKAAGIFCVAVPNAVTRALSLDHADYTMNSLADEPLDRVLARATRLRSSRV